MKGFTFWESYFASGNELSEEEESDLYRAIIRYAFLKEEPTFSGALRSVFNAVRPNIDLSVKRSKTLKAKNSKGKQSKTKTKPNANQNETKTKPKNKFGRKVQIQIQLQIQIQIHLYIYPLPPLKRGTHRRSRTWVIHPNWKKRSRNG